MLKTLLTIIIFASIAFPQIEDSLLIEQNPYAPYKASADRDSSVITDTTKLSTTVVKTDSLITIQGQPLTDVSTIISQRTFLFENYRYTGDLLRSFNLNFIKDLGFVGYPNETFIYGVGNGGISYMLDGVLWNNRFTNSLDLNFVQSEDIDSIEIVPSPRGFLYGPYGNPVTVNFITKDFYVPEPYSRIKYYQGPDAEAMIDVIFSAQLAEKWNLSFEVTNRSIDSTYTNTEFSFWNINSKLKYFLSNSVNITASYYFVSTKQGLNGGVDIDSVNNIPSSFNIDMYSPEAPVVFPNRNLDVLQNNFGLRTLAKPFDNAKLDLSIYYKYSVDMQKNYINGANFSEELDVTALGGNLTYFQRITLISFQLFSTIERNTYQINLSKSFNGDELYASKKSIVDNIFNIGGMFSLYLFDDDLQTSMYYKYNSLTSGNYNVGRSGLGIDLNYTLINNLKFYVGISSYKNYNSQDASSFEAGTIFNYGNLFVNIKYFDSDFNLFKPEGFYNPRPLWEVPINNVQGLGLNFNYKYWVLLLETNTSYYFKSDDTNKFDPVDDWPANLPRWQFIGGLYLTGLYFNDNLDLKTGFVFYYTGQINSSENYWQGSVVVNPTNKLDFTLAGEIKKVAIVYFIWENLLYNEYYITPYYPMPDGNIRFGIAWELFN